jgi:hypothetical protein
VQRRNEAGIVAVVDQVRRLSPGLADPSPGAARSANFTKSTGPKCTAASRPEAAACWMPPWCSCRRSTRDARSCSSAALRSRARPRRTGSRRCPTPRSPSRRDCRGRHHLRDGSGPPSRLFLRAPGHAGCRESDRGRVRRLMMIDLAPGMPKTYSTPCASRWATRRRAVAVGAHFPGFLAFFAFLVASWSWKTASAVISALVAAGKPA